MHKKFGFYIGLISLVMMGCQTEGTSQNPNFVLAEKCAKNGGVFNFKDDLCKCGNITCQENKYCNDNNSCRECEEDETKCIDSSNYKKCNGGSWINSSCKSGCNLETDKCFDCKSGDTKCENNIKFTCNEDGMWDYESNVEMCEFGCDDSKQCLTCKKDDYKCDKNDILKCDGHNWNKAGVLKICENNKVYKCDGDELIVENCDNGCLENVCKEVDCRTNDKKCITNAYGDAFVLTCENNKWPEHNFDDMQSPDIELSTGISYCGYKECLSEPLPKEGDDCSKNTVECLGLSCVSSDDWNKLACEDYKAIVIAYIKQLDGLKKKSLTQINSWFKISININSETILNNLSLCNFDKTEIDKSDIPDDDIKNMVDDYNNMYYETDTINLAKCEKFVEKYMCETNNPSEYSTLFTIIPIAEGAIINCNSNNEWDISNITPCLKPEYRYVNPENGQEDQPIYNIQFFPKACVNPLEGAKYSTACAINDKD